MEAAVQRSLQTAPHCRVADGRVAKDDVRRDRRRLVVVGCAGVPSGPASSVSSDWPGTMSESHRVAVTNAIEPVLLDAVAR